MKAQMVYRRFLVVAGLVTICFGIPLSKWVRFALHSGLFSYVLLVPAISAYLIWIRRKSFVEGERGSRPFAAITAPVGIGLLVAGGDLTFQILAYCCLLYSAGFYYFGLRNMRAFAFPALFLAFMAPIPERVVFMMETGLQYASAEVAYRFIKLSGIPVFRSGMDFGLPGLMLSVAPECSGIRSSLVLFITSLVAGYLFLRSGWARWGLALFVIPLGIVRNAFRILVLAYLTVRVDPSYIHSPLHHQGGPIFFVLSLIPFGIVLLLLRKIKA